MSLVPVDEEAFSSDENCYDWFVDNGALKHIINNSNYFIEFEKFEMELLLQMERYYQL